MCISSHKFSSSIEYKLVSWTLLTETENIREQKKIIDTIENRNKMRNINLNT